jgi:hypothetical protein
MTLNHGKDPWVITCEFLETTNFKLKSMVLVTVISDYNDPLTEKDAGGN